MHSRYCARPVPRVFRRSTNPVYRLLPHVRFCFIQADYRNRSEFLRLSTGSCAARSSSRLTDQGKFHPPAFFS